MLFSTEPPVTPGGAQPPGHVGFFQGKPVAHPNGSIRTSVEKVISPSGRVAPQDGGIRKSFHDYCRTVRRSHSYGDEGRYARKRLAEVYGTGWNDGPASVQKTAMAENSGTTGGYAVPQEYGADLLKYVGEYSIIYPRADVYPMSSRTMTLPKFDIETASGTVGVPSVGGSINFTWQVEGSQLAETESKFRGLDLCAWDLLGYSVISNQFLWDLDDDGEEKFKKVIAKTAAWYLEYAFLNGLGAGSSMPLGVLNAPGTITKNAGTPGTLAIGDISGMTGQFLPYSWTNGIWLCSPSTLDKIQSSLASQYFINIELGDAFHGDKPKPAGVLSTLPLYITDKLPKYGSNVVGSLVLMDPSLYVIGRRTEILLDFSPHYLFKTNQTAMRVWVRVDGKPYNDGQITLQDQSTKVSPFVILKA